MRRTVASRSARPALVLATQWRREGRGDADIVRAAPRTLFQPSLNAPMRWYAGGVNDDEKTQSRAAPGSASAYAQFQRQRGAFHSCSFHEKGSGPRSGAGQATDGDAEGDTAATGEKGEGGTGSPSATAQERRSMSRHWENAFFGRVHYEEGMHDRFQEAIDAEEHERIAGKSNEELFPNWAADEEAPPHLFDKLSPTLQLRYILNRLSMGERRVRYAVDYGSLSMMYQLNLGEGMVNEAEGLLERLGWMTEALQERIDEVKAVAAKVKFDYDLD